MMANPTNLQELADNLALNAEAAQQRAAAVWNVPAGQYHAGYREALLDTRATMLTVCAEQAPDLDGLGVTYACTREAGHRGAHEATVPGGDVLVAWVWTHPHTD